VTTRPPRALFVQFTNPAGYPPLEHAIGLLAARGWQVRVRGALHEGTEALALPPHPDVEVRCAPPSPRGARQKLRFARFVASAAAELRRWRPDVTYASDPLAAPIGLAAAALGVPVVYHEHDMPPSSATSAAARCIAAARRSLLARAAVCVAPGEARRARLLADGRPAGACTLVAWNTPLAREVRARPADPPPPLRVYFHGSIGPERLPATVVDGVARLGGGARLVIAGYEPAGHRGHVEGLRARAAWLGQPDLVEWHGALAGRDRLLELTATAHVGLCLVPSCPTDENLATLVGPSNKPFDYLARGLALLVPDRPDWRAAFVEPGLGLACDPAAPDSIAAALRRLQDDPAERRAMGLRGQALLRDAWCYERQFGPVLEQLEALAGGRTRG
jgi:glycosyltransferase involved in cell wall biosynthesis